MSVPAFLAELRSRDIGLWVDGDRLRCDAPAGVLTSELRDELQQHKSEILEFLRGPAELSFSQQRLWFLDQVDPGGSAYIVANNIAIGGTLDVHALERALEALVSRHDSLRTVFVNVEGRPMQVVSEPGPWRLPVIDLCAKVDAQERLQQLLREEATRGFDLARGPLFRAHLYRLAPDAHLLLLTLHHIITDGWSMGVLIRELGELYAGFSRGEEVNLPALRLQYRDFARWQRSQLQGEALEGLLSYWRSHLAGAPQVLELPSDRPRPPVESHRGALYRFKLPLKLVEALRGLSRREGATLFMTLLAGLSMLLSRYSGQQDLLIGTPVANRSQAAFDSLVGFFVNTLVLRAGLSGEPSVRQYLARMRNVCLDALTYQDLPFDRLVDEMRAQRDMSRNPLFQVMFALQNAPQQALVLPGLTLSPLDVGAGGAQFDVTLDVREVAEGLSGTFEYATDLFDESTIARMAAHWRLLLEGMVATPERRIWELPLLTEAERRQLLVEWAGTGSEYPREQSVHGLFEAQTARTPEAVAVEYEGRKLSYRELNARANQVARYLARHGVGPEVMVGICVERSLEMVVGVLGILKAGGAYVPLDPDYPASRLAFMLEDTAAPVLLTQASLRERLPAYAGRVVALDADWPQIAREGQENLGVDVNARNLAYMIYTSGSTGRPKGTCIEHRSVVRLVKNTNYIELGPEEVFLQFAPISFDASTLELWGSLLNGAKLVVCPAGRLSLQELGRVIQANGVTTLWLTAALFHQMVDEHIEALRGVRQLLAGGETLSVPHVRRMLKVIGEGRLINGYGPTENTTFTCCHVMRADSRIEQTVPIGRPIANTQVYVLDRHLQPVPVGVYGELYIGGDGLARKYLHQRELTAEKFVPDPFSAEPGARLYRTGDLVRYMPDGNIEFFGRIDQQVKIRGYRIELGEIEAALSQHPAVREVVVIAREDTPGDKRLVAYVVANEGAPVDLVGELRAHIRSTLPEYMVPAHFVTLEALPLTPNGKVDRKALPVPQASDRALGPSSYIAPRNDIEISLATAWERVLGVQRVGITDNFFELGGNSLSVLKLIFEMKQATGIEIDLGEIFRSPTIAGLVTSLGSNARKNASVVVPLQPEGNGLPVFCICGVNIYKHFAESLGRNQPVYGVYVEEEQAIVNEVISGEKPEVSIDRLVEAYYRAITRFQPHGPYRLAGLSFGGILAIELASKMRKSGAEVEVVFLLDAVLPQAVSRSWTKWISHQVTEIIRGNGLAILRRLVNRLRYEIAARWLRSGSWQTERRVDGTFRLRQEAAFLVAAEQWRAHPTICDFRVILFRATDLSIQGPHVEFKEDLGWGRYLGDWLTIVDAVGGHRGIIEPPNVAELGRKAQQCLQREPAKHQELA